MGGILADSPLQVVQAVRLLPLALRENPQPLGGGGFLNKAAPVSNGRGFVFINVNLTTYAEVFALCEIPVLFPRHHSARDKGECTGDPSSLIPGFQEPALAYP